MSFNRLLLRFPETRPVGSTPLAPRRSPLPPAPPLPVERIRANGTRPLKEARKPLPLGPPPAPFDMLPSAELIEVCLSTTTGSAGCWTAVAVDATTGRLSIAVTVTAGMLAEFVLLLIVESSSPVASGGLACPSNEVVSMIAGESTCSGGCAADTDDESSVAEAAGIELECGCCFCSSQTESDILCLDCTVQETVRLLRTRVRPDVILMLVRFSLLSISWCCCCNSGLQAAALLPGLGSEHYSGRGTSFKLPNLHSKKSGFKLFA